MKTYKDEKRRSQRIGIPLRVCLEGSTKVGRFETSCCDISGGGHKVLLDRELPVGKELKTLLYFPDDPRPILLFGKVAWSKRARTKDKRELYYNGIQHVRVSKKDNERFIFNFCDTMINFFMK